MVQLTPSEQLLLYPLTRLVRWKSKRQATRWLGFAEPSQTERVLASLYAKALIRYGRVYAVPPAECPILMHEHGPYSEPLVGEDKSLFFSRLHNKIKKHAGKTRPQNGKRLPRFPAIHATERAVNIYGGTSPNLSKPFQIEHDLKVTELVVKDREELEQSLLVGELAVLAHNASALARFNCTPPATNAVTMRFAEIPDTVDANGNSPTVLCSPLINDVPNSPLLDAIRRSKVSRNELPETFKLLSKFDRRWWGEDLLVRHKLSVGGYVPDLAIVIDGRIVHAVEVATISYGKERLVKIDDCCVANDVSYEIYA